MWWTLFYFVIAFHFVILAVYLYLIWNRNYWRKRGLYTARPITVLGTYPSIILQHRNTVYDIDEVYSKHKRLHRAVGVFVTRKPEVLILDPKLAHEILVTNFREYHDTLTSSWVNNRKADKYVIRNPFWCAGEEWKQRRTEAVGGLTQNKLKQAFVIWESTCHSLTKFLQEKCASGKAIIETKDLSYRFTADVMCDFIWGIDAGTFSNPNEPNAIVDISNRWLSHSFQTFGYSMMATIAPIVRRFLSFRFFNQESHDFFCKLTRDAVIMREKKPKVDRVDYLNYLLKLHEQKSLSDDDLVGYSLAVLLDGYETTGVVLMHTLFYLAKYPECQEKLRSEIRSNLKTEDGGITYENLNSLAYLDQCVHETLRLVTLVPVFSRICSKASTLQLSNEKSIEIEKGMVVSVPAYSFHHDEEYFPEPKSYNPERFDNGAHLELTKRGIFLPFGDGPRICMGMRVGLMTVKAALVEILSQYSVNDCPLTQAENTPNGKTFVLSLEGDIILEYKKL